MFIVNLSYRHVSFYVNTIKSSFRHTLFIMSDYGKSCRLNRLQLGQAMYFTGTRKHPLAPAVKIRNSALHISLLQIYLYLYYTYIFIIHISLSLLYIYLYYIIDYDRQHALSALLASLRPFPNKIVLFNESSFSLFEPIFY